jgi:hypothetical protein
MQTRTSGLCCAFALSVGTVCAGDAVWAAQAAPPTPSAGVVVNSPTKADEIQKCLADLKGAESEFHSLGTVTREGCTVEGAVELDAVSSRFGKVALPGKPTLACAFARQFTAWVGNVAAPLTLAYMGSKLTAVESGAAFVCRTRYSLPGEKISEHAKGDAVDVTAFRLENGRTLSVEGSSASADIDGILMRTFRATGCGYFTTILGPGSNEAHKAHFHFDYEMRGGSYNYRICE